MDQEKRTVFVVVSRSWGYDDEFWSGDDAPVKAFTQRAAAEAFAARCRARIEENPQGWEDYTIVEMEVPGG